MAYDPYAVLGVAPASSEATVKAAYRRLAKQYHPDLHPGDTAAALRMNEINAAYDSLKNSVWAAGAEKESRACQRTCRDFRRERPQWKPRQASRPGRTRSGMRFSGQTVFYTVLAILVINLLAGLIFLRRDARFSPFGSGPATPYAQQSQTPSVGNGETFPPGSSEAAPFLRDSPGFSSSGRGPE